MSGATHLALPPPYILVVEDDPDIRTALRDLLEDEGFRVATAAHGEQALEKLRQPGPAPAIILLDLMMPVMDGLKFREAQRGDARLATIPTIIMTASAQIPDPLVTNGRFTLKKPVRLETLLRAIRETLAAARPGSVSSTGRSGSSR